MQYTFTVIAESLEEVESAQVDRCRLDKYLAEQLEDTLSRERIKKLIQTGQVLVDEGPIQKPSVDVKLGQVLKLTLPEPEALNLTPENLPLEIIFEDEHLLVVNKPRNMLTHPTGATQMGTLVNALLYHCEDRLSSINGVIRPGIVHRLDKDTTGLLMVAKTDQAHHHLADQLKQKTARRSYKALVQGNLATDTGTIDLPIIRHPQHRNKMCVDTSIPVKGRHAVTHWQVLNYIHGKYCYVELRLETGRTHQIRVHLSHMGHPIIGDELYGSGIEKIKHFNTPGQLLQAFRLEFSHPVTQKTMQFELPEDPEILRVKAILEAA